MPEGAIPVLGYVVSTVNHPVYLELLNKQKVVIPPRGKTGVVDRTTILELPRGVVFQKKD